MATPTQMKPIFTGAKKRAEYHAFAWAQGTLAERLAAFSAPREINTQQELQEHLEAVSVAINGFAKWLDDRMLDRIEFADYDWGKDLNDLNEKNAR